jgi:hypothetical protein
MVPLLLAAIVVGATTSNRQTPSPSPTTKGGPTIVTKPWPSYLARDYDKPGHFKFTVKEEALVRKTLAIVKPCQRAFLRYAFPSNGDMHMVLYLENLHGNPHVLWTKNIYYQPLTGELNTLPGAEPEWDGIQYDVEHAGCSPEGYTGKVA